MRKLNFSVISSAFPKEPWLSRAVNSRKFRVLYNTTATWTFFAIWVLLEAVGETPRRRGVDKRKSRKQTRHKTTHTTSRLYIPRLASPRIDGCTRKRYKRPTKAGQTYEEIKLIITPLRSRRAGNVPSRFKMRVYANITENISFLGEQ